MTQLSIHTFEFTVRCNKQEFDGLIKSVNQYNTESVHPYDKPVTDSHGNLIFIRSFKYRCFRGQGINRLIFQKTMTPDNKWLDLLIKFIVNPHHLFETNGKPYTAIIGRDKINDIPPKLNAFIQRICPNFPDIAPCCKLSRIDYCLNYWMNSQEEVTEYFKLLKKTKLSAHIQQLEFYNEKKHRMATRDGELTIRRQSYDFSIYLKQIQMLHSSHQYTADEISNANGQLRIELRSNRKHLYNFKRNEDLQEELALLQISKPVDIIIKNLKAMYGLGDFYTMADAKDIVFKSAYGNKIKDNLIKILDIVKKSRSLNPEKNGLDKDFLERYMKYFNELELSPITIPMRYINEYYPNPIKYITGKADDCLRTHD